MSQVDPNTISFLVSQVDATVQSLQAKQNNSPESVVAEYLDKYQKALAFLKSTGGADVDSLKKQLSPLLNCARGYMEYSSDYMQPFLNEMGKTEKLIKAI